MAPEERRLLTRHADRCLRALSRAPFDFSRFPDDFSPALRAFESLTAQPHGPLTTSTAVDDYSVKSIGSLSDELIAVSGASRVRSYRGPKIGKIIAVKSIPIVHVDDPANVHENRRLVFDALFRHNNAVDYRSAHLTRR
jgi:hypothetical protein